MWERQRSRGGIHRHQDLPNLHTHRCPLSQLLSPLAALKVEPCRGQKNLCRLVLPGNRLEASQHTRSPFTSPRGPALSPRLYFAPGQALPAHGVHRWEAPRLGGGSSETGQRGVGLGQCEEVWDESRVLVKQLLGPA